MPAMSSSRRPPSPTASSTSAAATATSLALDLASGKLRWKYTTGNLIGESSPAVGADAVYVGDLGGLLHAVRHRRRQAALDVQDRIRDQVVAGRRRRRRARRLVRRQPLRPRRDDRPAAMEGARPTAWCTPRRPCRTDWRSSPAATRCCAPSASATARRRIRSSPAPTPARRRSSTAPARTSARSTTRCSPSICSAGECCGATPIRIGKFPFYSSAALANGRVILGGRDKFVHAIDVEDRQGGMDVRDSRARRFVAGRSPAAASTSARATAGSTCSTSTSGKKISEFDAGSGLTASPAIAAGRDRHRVTGRPFVRIGMTV